MCSLIENHLSWVMLWWRANYPDSVIRGYQLKLWTALNIRLPNPILNFCYKFTSDRKGMKEARAHDIGVLSQEEIVELGKNDLRVLSDLLAEKPFMFGNEPTLVVAAEVVAPPPKQLKDKENKEIKDKDVKEAVPAEKGPLADEPEKGKGDEEMKEQEQEPEGKNEKKAENKK